MAQRPLKKQTAAQKMAREDPDQYNTERHFAAEHIMRELLEQQAHDFDFETNDGDERLGSCELYGVDDEKDESGGKTRGAWVTVRFYVPNKDIDNEINQKEEP